MDGEQQLIEVNKYAYYIGRRRGLHTICFVHGLTGHPLKTWGRFPELLRSDADVPEIDILMSGYKSRLLLHGVHNLLKLGIQLMSTFALQIKEGRRVHMVGHSMGGLVSLQALVTEMDAGRAQQRPASCVQFISLVASPVTGKVVLAIIKKTFVVRRFFNRHLLALAGGSTAQQLIDSVKDHIYAPVTEDARHRRISIRMVMAGRDGAVDAQDKNAAKATFDKERVLELDFGHSSVKMPNSTGEDRYRAVAEDLKAMLAEPFSLVCKQCRDADRDVAEEGRAEFNDTYEPVVRRYYIDAGGGTQGDDYGNFVRAIWRDGALRGRPVHDAAGRAASILRALRKFPIP